MRYVQVQVEGRDASGRGEREGKQEEEEVWRWERWELEKGWRLMTGHIFSIEN